MKNYDVCVKETLERVIPTEAESREEAMRKVEEQYDNEEIVLDYEDYAGVDYLIINDEEAQKEEEAYIMHKAAKKMILENTAEMPLWIFDKLYNDGDIEDIELLNFEVMDEDEIEDIDYYPSWGTVFRVTSDLFKEKIKANMEAVNDLGLLIYNDYLNNEMYIGIDGGGYDFYEAYWEPLYKIFGFKWHLMGTV